MLDFALGSRLVFALGIANIIMLLLVFFSCRCMAGRFMKVKGYNRFFGWHCYFWLLFFISVILHAILAIAVFGVPR